MLNRLRCIFNIDSKNKSITIIVVVIVEGSLFYFSFLCFLSSQKKSGKRGCFCSQIDKGFFGRGQKWKGVL